MTYILVDTANTFFLARHVIPGDLETKIGMALHNSLGGGIRKAWQDFEGALLCFAWKDVAGVKIFMSLYKRNRSDAPAAFTEKEQEEETVFLGNV